MSFKITSTLWIRLDRKKYKPQNVSKDLIILSWEPKQVPRTHEENLELNMYQKDP